VFLFKLVRRIISSILLLAVIIPSFVAYRVWSTGHGAQGIKSDVIVVLGAAQYDGRPSDVLEARLKTAKTTFQAHLAPRIFTVGASEKGDRFTEAQASRNWLIAHGISAKAVTEISRGIDTLSSTQGYVDLMNREHLTKAIIVTDEYHCLRALTMARDLKISATCVPTLSGPASKSSSSLNYLVRETGAYLAYVTVGRHGIHLTDQVK
jgi:vancomycin permeability regulator SanA